LWPHKVNSTRNFHGWRTELLASQIASDLGHEKAWKLREKKENDEGIPFYLLLVPVIMYHGNRNRCRKKWRWSGLCRSRPGEDAGARRGIGDAASIGGVGSLGDNVLDCVGKGEREQHRGRACGTQGRIRSDGDVHIFTHKDEQYANC